MLGLQGTVITAGLTIPGICNDPLTIRNYLNNRCAAAWPIAYRYRPAPR